MVIFNRLSHYSGSSNDRFHCTNYLSLYYNYTLCREATLPGDNVEDIPEDMVPQLPSWQCDLSQQVKNRLTILRKMQEVVAPKVKENVERAQATQKKNYDARHNLQKVLVLTLFLKKV